MKWTMDPVRPGDKGIYIQNRDEELYLVVDFDDVNTEEVLPKAERLLAILRREW